MEGKGKEGNNTIMLIVKVLRVTLRGMNVRRKEELKNDCKGQTKGAMQMERRT